MKEIYFIKPRLESQFTKVKFIKIIKRNESLSIAKQSHQMIQYQNCILRLKRKYLLKFSINCDNIILHLKNTFDVIKILYKLELN